MIVNKYVPVVTDANYLGDFIIRVSFSNGIEKVIDFRKYLDGGIFDILKEEEYFKKYFLDGWTISWPNGADIAPETLYHEESIV